METVLIWPLICLECRSGFRPRACSEQNQYVDCDSPSWSVRGVQTFFLLYPDVQHTFDQHFSVSAKH